MTEDQLNEDVVRELQAKVAALPREIAPPEEAWGRIRSEIEKGLVRRTETRGARALFMQPVFLAAAALLLVAGSSIVTYIATGRTAVPNPIRAETVRSGSGPATLAEFASIENDYIGTANRLAAAIEKGETQLSPETIAKLNESLRVIDAAILEARRALAEDPANKTLIEMLSTSYSQKVDLLKRTTEMWQS